jgi:hypothetical protein
MRDLSISRAWEDTRTIVTREGRLFVSVALALVALPAVITGLVNPRGLGAAATPLWVDILVLICSLVAVAGQLAIVRLAIGPSTTVGDAIGHGMRRMPIYVLAALIIVAGLFIAAIPFGAVLTAMGVPLDKNAPVSGPVVIAILIYIALILFVGVRMMMSAPIASAEGVGPIAILRRSWALTAGNFWRLLGFLVLFVIAALAIVIGIASVTGALVALFLGPIEPMSLSALVTALVSAALNAALAILFAVMLARIYVQLTDRGEQAGEASR